jgi:hypothetical protein
MLVGLLPHQYEFEVAKLEPYGFFIVMILAATNNVLYRYWIGPVAQVAGGILAQIVAPLKYLLN